MKTELAHLLNAALVYNEVPLTLCARDRWI